MIISTTRQRIRKLAAIYKRICTDIADQFCGFGALAILGMLVPLVSSARGDQPRFVFGTAVPLAINTPDKPELHSTISGDGLSLYYVGGDPRIKGSTPDIIRATRESTSDPFSNPLPVPELSGSISALTPTISSDELNIIFRGSDAFYTSTRLSIDDAFAPPERVKLAVEDGNKISTVSLAPDGLSLYVQHETSGRKSDVYVARRDSKTAPWGDLQPVTPLWGDQYYGRPSISKDNLVLTFTGASADPQNRSVSKDSGDLYMVVRESEDHPWSKPVNLGDTVNTGALEDTFGVLSHDLKTLFFTRHAKPFDNFSPDLFQAPVLPFKNVAINGNGGEYSQDFDSMGTDWEAGVALPDGWTFTANDIIFNDVTTGAFPAELANISRVYNAGADFGPDRALAVNRVSSRERGELNLRTTIDEASAGAVQIAFDLEVWQARRSKAGFDLILEADQGDGFKQIVDLGEFAVRNLEKSEFDDASIDGNDDANRASFVADLIPVHLPVGATLRTRWISGTSSVVAGLDNVSLTFVAPGDTNLDGSVDFADFLAQSDNFGSEGRWAEGNLNADDVVDFADFLILSSNFGSVVPAATSVPEPSTASLCGFGFLALAIMIRRGC